jgi:FdhD protein
MTDKMGRIPINIESISVVKVSYTGRSREAASVAREFMLTIFLDGEELVTIMCSPENMKELTAGFLFSEGIISSKEDIKKIEIDEWMGTARVETADGAPKDSRFFSKRLLASGCGGSATFYDVSDAAALKIDSDMKLLAADVQRLANVFQHRSTLYQATHGLHSAALCEGDKIIIFFEDIGRHNAIDKIFGRCLLDGVSTENRFIVTSGRISSEIIQKIAKRGIPIVVSISVPTNLGIKVADKMGVTLIGLVRGGKMNVYTYETRVV